MSDKKDTRELNTVLSIVCDMPYAEKQQVIKAVGRLEAALSAVEAERDEEARMKCVWMEDCERARQERDRAEAALRQE